MRFITTRYGKGKLDRQYYFAVIILFVASLFRVYLFVNTPLSYRTEQVYDDWAMFNMAKNISAFHWLGEYSNITLIKEIAYPFLVAVCAKLSIPYSFMLGCLCVLSALVFVKAIRVIITNFYFKCVIFFALIYSPIGFFALVAQRTYQMAVVPYMALLLISCIVAVFLRRDRPNLWGGWTIGSAICLAFFWNIRSDTIWILPLVIVATAITIGSICWKQRKVTKKMIAAKLLPVIFPLAFLVLVNGGISFVNYCCYGVFVKNDRTQGNFSEMMDYFNRIESGEKDLDVWCSNKAIEIAMEASPTLNSIKENIETAEYSWSGGSYDDMKGDMPAWMLRTALSDAGLFSDAKQMEDFCGKVVDELEIALDEGKLKYENNLYLGGVQVQEEYIQNGEYVKDFLKYFTGVLKWEGNVAQIHGTSVSTGEIRNIREWELFFNSFTVYPDYINDETGEVIRDPASGEHYKVQKIVDVVCSFYKKGSGILNAIACVSLLVSTICLALRKENFDLWIIVLGVLLTAVLNIIAVTLFSSWFDEGMEPFIYMYLAGAYPLLQVSKYLSIYLGWVSIRNLLHMQSNKTKERRKCISKIH